MIEIKSNLQILSVERLALAWTPDWKMHSTPRSVENVFRSISWEDYCSQNTFDISEPIQTIESSTKMTLTAQSAADVQSGVQ